MYVPVLNPVESGARQGRWIAHVHALILNPVTLLSWKLYVYVYLKFTIYFASGPHEKDILKSNRLKRLNLSICMALSLRDYFSFTSRFNNLCVKEPITFKNYTGQVSCIISSLAWREGGRFEGRV